MTTKMRASRPSWNIPADLPSLIEADEYGIWDDDSWSPVLLTVMKGVIYQGRLVPLVWQVEFEPYGEEFEAGSSRLAELGLDQDGYGWATLIEETAKKYHPEIADELQFGDTEADTCVVWVESEASCRILMEMIWTILQGE